MERDNRDIINLERPESRHPRMARGVRAAQFAPFAAMVGHDAAIAEVDRVTEPWHEPTEEDIAEVNRLLVRLSRAPRGTPLRLTYFKADERKGGGEYLSVDSRLQQVDSENARIEVSHLSDGRIRVRFSDIVKIEIDGQNVS